jgi:hypothetical protein
MPTPEIWWSQTGSNRRPHACKARALPTELWPRRKLRGFTERRQAQTPIEGRLRQTDFLHESRRQRQQRMVGLGRLELPTSRLSSARSNQLSYKPEPLHASTRRQVAAALAQVRQLTEIDRKIHSQLQPPRPRDNGTGSSGKKEKRRRRSPANGLLIKA